MPLILVHRIDRIEVFKENGLTSRSSLFIIGSRKLQEVLELLYIWVTISLSWQFEFRQTEYQLGTSILPKREETLQSFRGVYLTIDWLRCSSFSFRPLCRAAPKAWAGLCGSVFTFTHIVILVVPCREVSSCGRLDMEEADADWIALCS